MDGSRPLRTRANRVRRVLRHVRASAVLVCGAVAARSTGMAGGCPVGTRSGDSHRDAGGMVLKLKVCRST